MIPCGKIAAALSTTVDASMLEPFGSQLIRATSFEVRLLVVV